MTQAPRAGRGRPRKDSTVKTLADYGVTTQQASEWGRMATVCERFENDALFELLLSLRKPSGRHLSEAGRRRVLRMAEALLDAGFSQAEVLEIVRTNGGGPAPKRSARKCPNCGVFVEGRRRPPQPFRRRVDLGERAPGGGIDRVTHVSDNPC